MNTELETSLVSKIRETYEASIAFAHDAKKSASLAIEKAVECGQFLIEAKQAVGHGKWLEWLANPNHGWNLSDETARKYMKLAEFVNRGGSLADAAGMRQAFITAGILLEPHREKGSQTAHNSTPTWISWLTKSTEQINKLKEQAPVDEWDEGTRSTMREKLRPLVELYAVL